MFQKGDEVWYSGDLTRPGCNAEYQVVDERLVSLKPKNLNWQEAAAMPLTTLTAWECIFDRMHISRDSGEDKNILIIGGAGGVGSIAIQLLKKTDQTGGHRYCFQKRNSRLVQRNWGRQSCKPL